MTRMIYVEKQHCPTLLFAAYQGCDYSACPSVRLSVSLSQLTARSVVVINY